MGDAPRHFLDLADVTPAELATLLDLAARLRAEPRAAAAALDGACVACYFEKPSTRTRVSFEAAVHRLGALPIVLTPAELQLARGEPISDTARVLSSYCAAIVARVFAQETLEQMAAHATVPVVNALSDDHHPCQALADLLTVRDVAGGLEGVSLAYVGDASNVLHSLLQAGALAGMDVRAACPPHLTARPDLVAAARDVAARTGAKITETSDVGEAVRGARVVYTDVWISMGQEAAASARRRALEAYRVTPEVMAAAAPDAVFMHCLPAHRGEEVAAEVIDGPRSVVFPQAANRLPTEQALLLWLAGGGRLDDEG
jgi:ornithine carbamoyltransferase